MVRKANSNSTKLKKALFVPLSFISILIVVGIAIFLLSIRQDKLLTYKDSVQQVADDFELIERSYSYLLNEIVTKRQPVAEAAIVQAADAYTALMPRVEQISKNEVITDASLSTLVTRRIANLALIKDLNALIRAEYETANILDNFESCKKKISFNKTSATVLPQLEGCTTYITSAQLSADKIPSFGYSNCQLNETPVNVIDKMADVHEKLVVFYRYSAKHKTKEAAVADSQYRAASTEAAKLPKWNKCITDFLQEKAVILQN